jgi:hypothetical protein
MFPNQSGQNSPANFQIFTPHGSTVTTDGWQTYNKPVGANMLFMMIIAAGGGGGTPAKATYGAGGGGSGGVSRLLIPAFLLPDIIYIRPGAGGSGAIVQGIGTDGTQSYIAIQPITTLVNSIMSQVGGIGGRDDFSGAGGAGGLIGTIGAFGGMGIFTSIAGETGSSALTSGTTTGNPITPGSSGIPITGGTAGGGPLGGGGNINAAGLWPLISGGAAGAVFGVGSDGFQRGLSILPGQKAFPFLFSGGTGSGGGYGSQAVVSGKGAWGCGGGGGASAALPGGLPGNGGNGGDALIIIGTM